MFFGQQAIFTNAVILFPFFNVVEGITILREGTISSIFVEEKFQFSAFDCSSNT